MRRGAKKDPQSKDTVAAVDRAISILETFHQGRAALSLEALSAGTGLYKSTALRLAQTLERRGYLARTQGGEYHVGPAVLRLASLYQAAVKPPDLIAPVLRELAEATRESAGFHVRLGEQRLCLYRVDSPQLLRDHFKPGDTLPLDRGAGSKVLRAFARPYQARYADVRRRLFAATAGETSPDMSGAASPVFEQSGELAGVLTLSGPTTRFHAAALRRFERELLQAARRLTEGLGANAESFHERLRSLAPPEGSARKARPSKETGGKGSMR
ncbi:MAG: IclR family transcriptional regulator [Burkholderiales bacterium]|nr:IclR family transcriptional regulator [Burkholderiales bacterium]